MYMILKTLSQWTHVVFLPFNRPQGIEYEHALWNIGVETGDIVEYRHLLKNRDFTAAILSRPSVCEAMLARIRRSAPGLGSYLELVVEYDDENVIARAYAIRCDREAPTSWE